MSLMNSSTCGVRNLFLSSLLSRKKSRKSSISASSALSFTRYDTSPSSLSRLSLRSSSWRCFPLSSARYDGKSAGRSSDTVTSSGRASYIQPAFACQGDEQPVRAGAGQEWGQVQYCRLDLGQVLQQRAVENLLPAVFDYEILEIEQVIAADKAVVPLPSCAGALCR